MRYFIIAFIGIPLFLSCHKECNDLVNYDFVLPATLSPTKDTFKIGDTIDISSEFSDMVFDRATNKTYKLENWKFYPETTIVRIDDTTVVTDNLSEFSYFIDPIYNYKLFSYSDGGKSLVGQYNYQNNAYKLEYKLIPNQRGLYFLRHTTDLYNLGKKQDFEGRCPKGRAGLDGYVNLNGGADNNINMLSSSPDPHYNDWILQKPEERFHKFGGYCFYVQE